MGKQANNDPDHAAGAPSGPNSGAASPDDDKRQSPRVPSSLPMQYQVSTGTQWVQGQGQIEVVDVSLGGVRIRLDCPIEPESQLYLLIPLLDGPVYTLARVAWSAPQPDGDFLAGIEFLDLTDDVREKLVSATERPDEKSSPPPIA